MQAVQLERIRYQAWKQGKSGLLQPKVQAQCAVGIRSEEQREQQHGLADEGRRAAADHSDKTDCDKKGGAGQGGGTKSYRSHTKVTALFTLP